MRHGCYEKQSSTDKRETRPSGVAMLACYIYVYVCLQARRGQVVLPCLRINSVPARMLACKQRACYNTCQTLCFSDVPFLDSAVPFLLAFRQFSFWRGTRLK